MKQISIFLLAVVFFMSACNSNQEDTVKNPPQEEVTDSVTTIVNNPDSMRTIINRSMIWTVQPEGANKDKLKAPDSAQIKNYSYSQLIDLLNSNYPDIQMNFEKVSHDTIYIKIPDSQKLTNGLGDTGAENYLASATYTLTEMPNIHFVNIKMKSGDHAEAGVYSRDDFKDLR
ncbi:MAG: hypothetical protein ACTHML_10385 [Ginsengibacter sp.]